MGNINIQIGERLKKIRILLGFSKATTFSAKLGLENQTYGRYENGERSLPDETKILLHGMGVNISWLVTGQGEPLLDKQDKKIPLIEELQGLIEETAHPKFSEMETRLSAIENLLKKAKPAPEASAASSDGALYTAEPEPAYEYGEEEEYERVSYFHDIAAGPPIAIDEDPSQTVEVPARLLKPGGRYYAASVRGTSMTGAGILDGDMALIRWADVPKDGAIQVVRYKDRVTLKRMREVAGKGWELRYMDGSGQVVLCDSAEYDVLGEFVAILPESAAPRER